MRVLLWYLNIHTIKQRFINNSTSKQGKNNNKDVKKTNICMWYEPK